MSKAKIYDPHFSDRVKFILETKFQNNNSEFARTVGVAVTSLNRWVSGEADPSRTNLVKMAEVADVSLEWLATGRTYEEADIFLETNKQTKELNVQEALQALQQAIERQVNAQPIYGEMKLDKQEKELVISFRSCDEAGKTAISAMAQTMARLASTSANEISEDKADRAIKANS